eukprot:3099046-Rhodomonas_salina.1
MNAATLAARVCAQGEEAWRPGLSSWCSPSSCTPGTVRHACQQATWRSEHHSPRYKARLDPPCTKIRAQDWDRRRQRVD